MRVGAAKVFDGGGETRHLGRRSEFGVLHQNYRTLGQSSDAVTGRNDNDNDNDRTKDTVTSQAAGK
jgi:hypothetical protein